jgi:hypothetical protein
LLNRAVIARQMPRSFPHDTGRGITWPTQSPGPAALGRSNRTA